MRVKHYTDKDGSDAIQKLGFYKVRATTGCGFSTTQYTRENADGVTEKIETNSEGLVITHTGRYPGAGPKMVITPELKKAIQTVINKEHSGLKKWFLDHSPQDRGTGNRCMII